MQGLDLIPHEFVMVLDGMANNDCAAWLCSKGQEGQGGQGGRGVREIGEGLLVSFFAAVAVRGLSPLRVLTR